MKQDVFFWFKELMKIEMKKKSLISLGLTQETKHLMIGKKRSQEKCDQSANWNKGKNCFRRGSLQELVGVSGQSNQSYPMQYNTKDKIWHKKLHKKIHTHTENTSSSVHHTRDKTKVFTHPKLIRQRPFFCAHLCSRPPNNETIFISTLILTM